MGGHMIPSVVMRLARIEKLSGHVVSCPLSGKVLIKNNSLGYSVVGFSLCSSKASRRVRSVLLMVTTATKAPWCCEVPVPEAAQYTIARLGALSYLEQTKAPRPQERHPGSTGVHLRRSSYSKHYPVQ